MQKDLFEAYCAERGLAILPKVDTRYGEILLAEYFCEDPFPHFKTYWFVNRDGLDFGRWVSSPAYINERGGLIFPVPLMSRREDRIDEAVADAMAFIALNVECGRYDG